MRRDAACKACPRGRRRYPFAEQRQIAAFRSAAAAAAGMLPLDPPALSTPRSGDDVNFSGHCELVHIAAGNRFLTLPRPVIVAGEIRGGSLMVTRQQGSARQGSARQGSTNREQFGKLPGGGAGLPLRPVRRGTPPGRSGIWPRPFAHITPSRAREPRDGAKLWRCLAVPVRRRTVATRPEVRSPNTRFAHNCPGHHTQFTLY